MDGPERLLEFAARWCPDDREEWGRAMRNELGYVDDPRARWRFAIGCVRAVLVALLAPPSRGLEIAPRVLLLLGATVSVVASLYVLRTWRHAGGEVDAAALAAFAMALLASVWFALRPPHLLAAHRGAATRGAWIGAGLAVVVAGGLQLYDLLVSPSQGDTALGLLMLGTLSATLLGAGLAAARAARSFAAGLAGALWVSLVCSIVAFDCDLLGLLGGFNLEAHMRHALPPGIPAGSPDEFMAKHITRHFAASMGGFVRLPLLALIAGSLGAWIGLRLARSPADRAATPRDSLA